MMKAVAARARTLWVIRQAEMRDAGMSTLEALLLLGVVLGGAALFAGMFRGKLQELITDFNAS